MNNKQRLLLWITEFLKVQPVWFYRMHQLQTENKRIITTGVVSCIAWSQHLTQRRIAIHYKRPIRRGHATNNLKAANRQIKNLLLKTTTATSDERTNIQLKCNTGFIQNASGLNIKSDKNNGPHLSTEQTKKLLISVISHHKTIEWGKNRQENDDEMHSLKFSQICLKLLQPFSRFWQCKHLNRCKIKLNSSWMTVRSTVTIVNIWKTNNNWKTNRTDFASQDKQFESMIYTSTKITVGMSVVFLQADCCPWCCLPSAARTGNFRGVSLPV